MKHVVHEIGSFFCSVVQTVYCRSSVLQMSCLSSAHQARRLQVCMRVAYLLQCSSFLHPMQITSGRVSALTQGSVSVSL